MDFFRNTPIDMGLIEKIPLPQFYYSWKRSFAVSQRSSAGRISSCSSVGRNTNIEHMFQLAFVVQALPDLEVHLPIWSLLSTRFGFSKSNRFVLAANHGRHRVRCTRGGVENRRYHLKHGDDNADNGHRERPRHCRLIVLVPVLINLRIVHPTNDNKGNVHKNANCSGKISEHDLLFFGGISGLMGVPW